MNNRKNWLSVTIGDICEVVMGQSPPSKYYNTEKQGLPFYQGKAEFGEVYPTPQKWCNRPLKVAQRYDILLSIRAPVGPTNICNEISCIGRGLAAIRYVFVDAHKFIFYYLKSIQNEIAKIGTGSTFSAISKSQILNLQIPLPPLAEQHRIVAKIEELFTKLDAGVEALKKIKDQIKRYRQAVLKYAFEGKLTEHFRESHKGQLEPASALLERIVRANLRVRLNPGQNGQTRRSAPTEELPEGWVWVRLGEINEVIMGQSPPSDSYNTEKIGLPFYQGKAEFGDVYPTPIKWCSNPIKIAEKYDILISVRAPVGPTNICYETSCIGRGLAAIRYNFKDGYKFLFYYLRLIQPHIAKIGTGSTFSAISKSQISNLQIPLPPLPEQHKIVEEIERRFSIADSVEKIVDQSLKQAERLRQSILKRAFEGKLVPQDPNDEPAERLLERIKSVGVILKLPQRKKEIKRNER